MKGAQFERMVKVKANDQGPAERGTRRAAEVESAFSKVCANQLVVGTMFVCSAMTQRRQRGLDLSLQPLLRWFEEAAHRCRSADDNFAWLHGQIDQDFFLHLGETSQVVVKQANLEWVGLTIPKSNGAGGWVKLDDLWLSCLLDPMHRLIVRERQSPDKLLYCVGTMPGSCSFGWPMTQHDVPRTPDRSIFLPVKEATHMSVPIVLVNLDDWEAVAVTWRRPLWAHMMFERARGQWSQHSCMAFPTDGAADFKPLIKVAAEQGFWNMDLSSLTRLTKHFALDHGPTSTVFDLCWGLVRHVTGCEASVAVDLLKTRCVEQDASDECNTDFLLDLDDGLDALDESDKKELVDERSRRARRTQQAKQFATTWRAKNQEVRPTPPPAQAKAKAKSKGRGKGKKGTEPAQPTTGRYPPFPAEMISQPLAASMAPPGGSIWRNLAGGGWQCQYPPYRRRGYSWAREGYTMAARRCLEYMWELYLGERGQTCSDCPVDGLFDHSQRA